MDEHSLFDGAEHLIEKAVWSETIMRHTVKINQNYQFRRLYKTGKSLVSPYFALYYRRNRLGKNRLGITATKKIGNAVERNRARRLIMESYRLLEGEIPKGMDMVLVARKRTVEAKMQPVRESMRLLFQGLHVGKDKGDFAKDGAKKQ